MDTSEKLRDRLLAYAAAKPGAQNDSQGSSLPCEWGDFVRIESKYGGEDAPVAIVMKIPVLTSRKQEMLTQYPQFELSHWWNDDKETNDIRILLSPDVTDDFYKNWIDQAYNLVWKTLCDKKISWIEDAMSSFTSIELIDRLIDRYQLAAHRDLILSKLSRPALFMKTTRIDDEAVPLGGTKLGGYPDLPDDLPWPEAKSTPLAFLGQFDLSKVAKFGSIIEGLPRAGLMTVFSAYGWIIEGNYDNWQPNCTVIFHVPPDKNLRRRELPKTLQEYQPFHTMGVEWRPCLSLPNHREEPVFKGVLLSEDEYQRFDEMQMGFSSIQMYGHLNRFDSSAENSRLGGYAFFPQCYPRADYGYELPHANSRMFIQFGSDNDWCDGMNWAGDGGDLVVYVDSDGLREGRFEKVQNFIQGG